MGECSLRRFVHSGVPYSSKAPLLLRSGPLVLAAKAADALKASSDFEYAASE